jgi:hypothetical protein
LFASNRRALAFLSEIVEDIAHLKPRIKMNRRFEYEPYEHDRGVYLVDVTGIKGLVEADRRAEEDLLVSNYWALLLGLLRYVNPGDVVDTGGTVYSIRATGDVNHGVAYLVYGTSTAPETFTDNALKSYSGSISTSIAISYMSDRTRVALSGVVPAVAYELGVYQYLYDTGGSFRLIMLARKVGSWSANQAVSYYIDFFSPWVKQVGDLIYGILRNVDVSTQRIDGTTITLRTSAAVNSSSIYLVISPTPVSWSPSLYSVPGAVTPSNYYTDILGSRYIRATIIHALMAPSSNMEVNTLGLYQPVYDSAGATHTVCWLVLPLASPITLYAGRNNLIVLRIIAL